MAEAISNFENVKENRNEGSKKKSVFKFVLAFQHLIAMFGSTVLVPMLTGLDVSVALFCAGVGTLIFHICTKRKVPVFLGITENEAFRYMQKISMDSGKRMRDIASLILSEEE